MPDSSSHDEHAIHVVYLVNFFAPDQVAIWDEIARRVAKVTILVSVEMESNRNWKADHAGLDVRVQRTRTITRKVDHSAGYHDVNYVHFPLDTGKQLRNLDPDVVVSAELGMRSWLASRFCRRHRSKFVIAVSTSEHLDEVRSGLRTKIRKRLLSRADCVTYHGPSCRRFLEKLDVPEVKLAPFDYAADPKKPYRGEIQSFGGSDNEVRLLTVGQLIDRKGIMPALDAIKDWAAANPDKTIQWTLAGSGPLAEALSKATTPKNFKLKMTGNLDAAQICDQYRDNEVMFFATLADEWGLVVDEALFSGMAVIGSRYAQAVETLVTDGHNGWEYDPKKPETLSEALNAWFALEPLQRYQMRVQSRESVAHRTPSHVADQLLLAIKS